MHKTIIEEYEDDKLIKRTVVEGDESPRIAPWYPYYPEYPIYTPPTTAPYGWSNITYMKWPPEVTCTSKENHSIS